MLQLNILFEMYYFGTDAIDILSKKIDKTDPAESSHWKKYHKNFKYNDGVLTGIQGFGGSQSPYSGLKKTLHYLFQKRYRNLGEQYDKFKFIDLKAKQITFKQRRAYDLDVLRQTLSVAMLSSYENVLGNENKVLIIGDGFGSLSSILLASNLSNQIILVNLTKTLLVDLIYLKKWMGETKFDNSVVLIDSEKDVKSIQSSKSIVAIEASKHKIIRNFKIDTAISIASMQEMNPSMVESYFKDLSYISKKKLYFYCCNREEKILPDSTISRLEDYPWNKGDSIILDELCPWHQNYYTIFPPMYKKYDGPHRHQLRIMKFN